MREGGGLSLKISGSEKGVFWKRGLLEKGSFQKSPFSRDSREFLDSRDFREPPDCGKYRRIRPFPRDSRESRDSTDSRDSSSEKTPFVMTPFSGPENSGSRWAVSWSMLNHGRCCHGNAEIGSRNTEREAGVFRPPCCWASIQGIRLTYLERSWSPCGDLHSFRFRGFSLDGRDHAIIIVDQQCAH